MSEQTKLTPEAKQALRNLREYQTGEVHHFPQLGICVYIEQTGPSMACFSVAIMAETETKYRKKVGEYLVRERMDNGVYLPCRVYSSLQNVAGSIAESLV